MAADVQVDDDPISIRWKFRRGDDLARSFRVSSVIAGTRTYWDLTDFTIAGQVRSTADSETSLGAITGTAASDQVDDRGVFTLTLDGDDTQDFPSSPVGDVEFTDGSGNTVTLIDIKFKVSKDVTRSA